MKQCIFCHKSPPEVHFTKEHVLRAKLAKIVTGTPKSRRMVSTHRTEASDEFKDRVINIPQSPFNGTINLVCNECNNGWLNTKIEIPCEKYIDGLVLGNISDLDFIAKNRIALWAVKTAAVRGLVDPEPRGLPEAHYIWIKEQLTPPPFTHIWLCKTLNNTSTLTRHIRHLAFNSELNEYSPMHLSIINIGFMGLIVLGCGSQYGETVRQDFISSLQSFPAQKIWPPSSEYIYFHTFNELHPEQLMELTDQVILDKKHSTRRLLV